MSRPPNYEFQEWWNKQRAKETADDPLLPSSASQHSRFQSVNIHGPASPASCRGFTSSSCTKSRTPSRSSPAAASRSSALYKIIKLFLVLTVFLLVFELVAYFKGWHFSPPSLESEIEYSVEYVYAKWLEIRAYYLAPLLQSLTNACIVLFMIQSVDRFVFGARLFLH